MYSTSSNPPFYVNVEYSTGKLANYWMDSLSASFAGLQVVCTIILLVAIPIIVAVGSGW
jgi:hypothetical protein